MHLVRDLLDKRVIDRNGREVGRVDGVVLDVAAGQPRVAAIEIGLSVAARRVRPFIGRLAAALELTLNIDQGRPLRIPFAAVLEIGDHVRVDLVANDSSATILERRLRHLMRRVRGAR